MKPATKNRKSTKEKITLRSPLPLAPQCEPQAVAVDWSDEEWLLPVCFLTKTPPCGRTNCERQVKIKELLAAEERKAQARSGRDLRVKTKTAGKGPMQCNQGA